MFKVSNKDTRMESLTFFRMGEGEGAKRPSTSFSPPVTFTNVRIDPQNFLTSVAKNSNISKVIPSASPNY